MNKEIKEKWLKALRSGKYKQGSERLYKKDHGKHFYCCLGVLVEECLDGYWEEHNLFGWTVHDSRNNLGSSIRLPVVFRDEIGISEEDEDILISYNDYDMGFEEIADWIEKHL